jgi:hypothetical protein
VVNLRQIGRVLHKTFSELLAEVEARKGEAAMSIAEAEVSAGVVESVRGP